MSLLRGQVQERFWRTLPKKKKKARSVATGVSFQRGSGTSQKKCGYRLRSPDNAPCVQRNEAWQLGEFLGRMQEGRKAVRMDLRKDSGSV